MLRLYTYGGGSTEIFLEDPAERPEIWMRTKRKAVELLRMRKWEDAAQLLDELPFELVNGSNSFGDEFLVLHVELPVARYVQFADGERDAGQRALFRAIADALKETDNQLRFIAVSVADEDEPVVVPAPSPSISSSALEASMSEVERCLAAGQAATGIDRIHTGLHEYLKNLARSAGLPYEGASITGLFKTLRKGHPALQPTGPRAEDITRVVKAMATIIDALNPLRNKASLAHPTDELLEDAEAMLVINAVRTLLHYIEKRTMS